MSFNSFLSSFNFFWDAKRSTVLFRMSRRTCVMLIISAGIASILASMSAISETSRPTSSLPFSQRASFLDSLPSHSLCSSCASSISTSYSLSSMRFSAPFISEASSFANLNFFSNISKSRNFARISFLFVLPSLMKERLSNWLERLVRRKSSIVPNTFLMFLSVSFLVSPFRLTFSPFLSILKKSKSVLASSVSTPLRRLVYFVEDRRM